MFRLAELSTKSHNELIERTKTMTELHITRDTNRPSRSAIACRVSYSDTTDAPHELRQVGPVWNNVIHYRGVYETPEAARAAARAYIRGG